jgi:hypothetical protein
VGVRWFRVGVREFHVGVRPPGKQKEFVMSNSTEIPAQILIALKNKTSKK